MARPFFGTIGKINNRKPALFKSAIFNTLFFTFALEFFGIPASAFGAETLFGSKNDQQKKEMPATKPDTSSNDKKIAVGPDRRVIAYKLEDLEIVGSSRMTKKQLMIIFKEVLIFGI